MTDFQYGFTLPDGSIIAHGEGVFTKQAFPPETDLPGTLHTFSPGHGADTSIPCFCGSSGVFNFDTTCRMPRHVHMTTEKNVPQRFVTEKIIVLNGVGLVELSGIMYVIPPMSMVIIKPGSPHTWTACPAGLDLQKLGLSPEPLISQGHFIAVYEYDQPTKFYPTASKETMTAVEEYVGCDELQDIRFPELTVEEVIKQCTFVWGRLTVKLS